MIGSKKSTKSTKKICKPDRDNFDKCEVTACNGGLAKDCFEHTFPEDKLCRKCLCYNCLRSACPPHYKKILEERGL